MISQQDGHKAQKTEGQSSFPVSPVIPVEMEREIRCPCSMIDGKKCERLLGKGYMAPGTAIQIKCPKCKNYPRFGSL